MSIPKIILTKKSSSGAYKVYVDDVLFSSHNEEKEAVESAVNQKFENPDAVVTYGTNTVVAVEISNFDAPVTEEPPTEEPPVEEPPTEEPPVEEPTPDPEPPVADGDFLSVSNADLVDSNNQVYRFNGTNAYYLPNYQIIDERVVDRAFDAFVQGGVKMVRMWAFYDGPAIWDGDNPMQPSAGVYNEDSLIALDKVIAKGKDLGMRFVLPFVNYWDELGGISKYVEWATGTADRNMSTFVRNEHCQDTFKKYISMLLNRINTVTGVAYKDEPAIAIWEIGNELRGTDAGPEEIRDWYQSIAQYIKSIDSNHLVATGEEGYDHASLGEWSRDGSFVNSQYTSADYSNTYVLRSDANTSYILNTEIPEIDVATCHWYPSVFGFGSQADSELLTSQNAFIKDRNRIAKANSKPMFIGEYGFPGFGDQRVSTIYSDLYKIIEEDNISGSLLWQLAADWIKCWEYGGNICYPAGRADTELFNLFKAHSDNLK